MDDAVWAKYANLAVQGLSNRDHFELSFEDADFGQQLGAFSHAIRSQRRALAAIEEEMAEINRTSDNRALSEREIDEFGELFYAAMYLHAANSLSGSAMLAALLESVFKRLFEHLKREHRERLEAVNPTHPRWQMRGKDNSPWNPLRPKRDGIVAGVLSLSDAIGLQLPDSLKRCLPALFAYRNAMLHNSIDWPRGELDKFTERMRAENWSESWFESTKRGRRKEDAIPVMYALTDEFFDEVLAAVRETADTVGGFLRNLRTHN